MRNPGHQEVGGQLVDIPRGLPATPPLLLAFHGLGQSGARFAQDTDLDGLAARHHFVVAYPEANASFRWQLNHRAGDDDIRDTARVIDNLVRTVCVDPHRVYATGFSNGASFTARVGCELADRIAAIAPVSGSYSTVACPAGALGMPTLEIHGRDPWLRTVPGLMDATAKRNGCSSPPRTMRRSPAVLLTVWPGCNLERVRLSRTEHIWPRRHGVADNDASGFSASQAIWRFVSRYER